MTKVATIILVLAIYGSLSKTVETTNNDRISTRLVGGHLNQNADLLLEDDDDDDTELLIANESGGSNKKEANGEEEKKTLAQQVAEGKYGLIQKELFSKPLKRPGVLSYEKNDEVPKDTIKNLGGLSKNDIWLAENHLLVIKGGVFENNPENDNSWEPIDDYVAPLRQVKIPNNPKVPPPFPVQLEEGGPLQIIGPNFTRTLNGTFEAGPYPILPPEEGAGYFYDSPEAKKGQNPAYSLAGEAPFPIPPFPPVPGDYPAPPLPGGGLNNSYPPFSPPFLPAIPPNQQGEIEEDDPSIYYPPPYSFFYPKDNNSVVSPGPLVPGIVLPPPPNFFAPLDEKTTAKSSHQIHPTTTPIPPTVFITKKPSVVTIYPVKLRLNQTVTLHSPIISTTLKPYTPVIRHPSHRKKPGSVTILQPVKTTEKTKTNYYYENEVITTEKVPLTNEKSTNFKILPVQENKGFKIYNPSNHNNNQQSVNINEQKQKNSEEKGFKIYGPPPTKHENYGSQNNNENKGFKVYGPPENNQNAFKAYQTPLNQNDENKQHVYLNSNNVKASPVVSTTQVPLKLYFTTAKNVVESNKPRFIQRSRGTTTKKPKTDAQFYYYEENNNNKQTTTEKPYVIRAKPVFVENKQVFLDNTKPTTEKINNLQKYYYESNNDKNNVRDGKSNVQINQETPYIVHAKPVQINIQKAEEKTPENIYRNIQPVVYETQSNKPDINTPQYVLPVAYQGFNVYNNDNNNNNNKYLPPNANKPIEYNNNEYRTISLEDANKYSNDNNKNGQFNNNKNLPQPIYVNKNVAPQPIYINNNNKNNQEAYNNKNQFNEAGQYRQTNDNQPQYFYVTSRPYVSSNKPRFRLIQTTTRPQNTNFGVQNNNFGVHIAKLQEQLKYYTTSRPQNINNNNNKQSPKPVYQFSFQASDYKGRHDPNEDKFRPLPHYSVQIQPAIEVIPTAGYENPQSYANTAYENKQQGLPTVYNKQQGVNTQNINSQIVLQNQDTPLPTVHFKNNQNSNQNGENYAYYQQNGGVFPNQTPRPQVFYGNNFKTLRNPIFFREKTTTAKPQIFYATPKPQEYQPDEFKQEYQPNQYQNNQFKQEYQNNQYQPHQFKQEYQPNPFIASTARPITQYSFEATQNPIYQQGYTKQDEIYFDDNTKKYFTVFGKKIPGVTTPANFPEQTTPKNVQIDFGESIKNPVSLHGDTLVNYVKPHEKNKNSEDIHGGGNPNKYTSLHDDLRVNYQPPLPQVNPDAEFINGPIGKESGSYISYQLPGDDAHFYFLTPQLAQKRDQGVGYFFKRDEQRNQR